MDHSHHIYMPFVGGYDCRAALRLVLQLAENLNVTATLEHVQLYGRSNSTSSAMVEDHHPGSKATMSMPSTRESDMAFFATMQESLSGEVAERVTFKSLSVPSVLDAVIERAQTEMGQNPKNGGDIVVLVRSCGMKSINSGDETACLGVAAERLIAAGVNASLLIVQAKERGWQTEAGS